MNLQEQNTLNELLFRLLDNEICDSDFSRLEHRLRTDPEVRAYYCRFMEDASALSLRASVAMEPEETESNTILEAHFWQELIAEERNAPALDLVAEKPPSPAPVAAAPRKPSARRVNKASLAAAILSAAALLFVIVSVHLAPPMPYEVATVSDFLNARWTGPLPLERGSRVTTHSEPIRLTEGVVKLMTDENVEVVLEAPTEFTFVSYSEIALQYGKLFARVSEQGLGFSVATPNSKIVDLGTEFGVLCHLNGDTEVHVYKGKANLFAGQKNAGKTSEVLPAGSARKVRHTDSAVCEIPLVKNMLVRTVHSQTGMVWKGQPLSLADVVGGGRGFGGGRLYTGIDAATGRTLHHLEDIETHIAAGGFRAAAHPFVDGVFVPGAGSQQTQIASDGTTTTAFPKTSGALWGYIFSGARHEGITTPRHELRLDGTVYGTPRRPAITMHSNQGITFDLDRIRADLPGLSIRSFETLAGVSETVRDQLKREQGRSFDDFPEVKKVFDAQGSRVEFWVLLDGRLVFHQECSSRDGAHELRIPIAEQDRFLTLAVTEADDTQAYDWALFGRPQLILEAGP